MEGSTAEIRYFEDVLQHTGWGLYYKLLIGLSSTCQFVKGVIFATIVFTVALSTCDRIYIPENYVLRMFTSHLCGCGIGGLIGNPLLDKYGRKIILGHSLICVFFSSFVAAFSYNINLIVGAIFALGVGLEIYTGAFNILVAEIVRKNRRGSWITFCNLFYALGFTATAFSVILFKVPTFLHEDRLLQTKISSWRIMFASCGGVILVIACLCALLEESPRYYLFAGRNYLAYLLLKQLYAINNSKYAEYFQVKEEELRNIIHPYDLNNMEPDSYLTILKHVTLRYWKSLKLIFSKPFRKNTWVLMALKFPFLFIGTFQLKTVLSKLLIFNGTEMPQKLNGMDFVYPISKVHEYDLTAVNPNPQTSSDLCRLNKESTSYYNYFLILCAGAVLGQAVCMFVVDKMGRKYLIFLGLVLASSSFLIMAYVKNDQIQLVATGLIITCTVAVSSTLTIANLELYPTAVRGTAIGIINFPGYLLAVIFVNVIVIEPTIFCLIIGILYFCISIFTFYLPELKGKPMVE